MAKILYILVKTTDEAGTPSPGPDSDTLSNADAIGIGKPSSDVTMNSDTFETTAPVGGIHVKCNTLNEIIPGLGGGVDTRYSNTIPSSDPAMTVSGPGYGKYIITTNGATDGDKMREIYCVQSKSAAGLETNPDLDFNAEFGVVDGIGTGTALKIPSGSKLSRFLSTGGPGSTAVNADHRACAQLVNGVYQTFYRYTCLCDKC